MATTKQELEELVKLLTKENEELKSKGTEIFEENETLKLTIADHLETINNHSKVETPRSGTFTLAI